MNVSKNDDFRLFSYLKNEDFLMKNDGFLMEIEDFLMKNDDFVFEQTSLSLGFASAGA